MLFYDRLAGFDSAEKAACDYRANVLHITNRIIMGSLPRSRDLSECSLLTVCRGFHEAWRPETKYYFEGRP